MARTLSGRLRRVGAIAPLALVVALAPTGGVAADPGPVRVVLVNADPGTSVDVVVGDKLLVLDLAAGQQQDLTPLAGQTLRDVRVVRARTDDLLVAVDVLPIAAAGAVSWVLHLDAAGAPTLTAFEDDVGPLAAGAARLTLRHAAAFGPADVTASIGSPPALVAAGLGIANGAGLSVDLPAAGVDRVALQAAGGGDAVLEVRPVSLPPGQLVTAYVVGGTAGQPLQPLLFVAEGLMTPPTRVETGVGALVPPGGRRWPTAPDVAALVLMTAIAAAWARGRLDGRAVRAARSVRAEHLVREARVGGDRRSGGWRPAPVSR